MDPQFWILLLGAVFFLVLAISLALYAQKPGKLVRQIKELPTTPIAKLKPGLVEVKGEVSALDVPLESPVTRELCVYFHFRVLETRGGGKHSRTIVIVDDKQYAKCLVEDETGSCELDLREAKLFLDVDSHGRSGLFKSATPEFEQLLQTRYGESAKGWIFNKNLNYKEIALEEGEQVYVLGTAENLGGAGMRITKGLVDDVFVVSDKSETNFLRGRVRWMVLGWVVSFAFLTLAGVLAFFAFSS